MKEIIAYKVCWNAAQNEGILLVDLAEENGVTQILLDSPEETSLLLDILRNEKPVFYEKGLLFTGFEPVGEGDEDADSESPVAAE